MMAPLACRYIFIAHAVCFYLISGQNFKSGHFFHIHSHKNLDFSVFLEKSDVAKQGPHAYMVLLAGVE